jgi:4-carboxymuconolactone decarboxylase
MAKGSEGKALDDLNALAPEFAKLTRDFLFGDIWNRPGLSQRDRSLITVTCLVSLNRIEQVEFHLKRPWKTELPRKNLWRPLRTSPFTPAGRPPPQVSVT